MISPGRSACCRQNICMRGGMLRDLRKERRVRCESGQQRHGAVGYGGGRLHGRRQRNRRGKRCQRERICVWDVAGCQDAGLRRRLKIFERDSRWNVAGSQEPCRSFVVVASLFRQKNL
jgi:hypothetical protein